MSNLLRCILMIFLFLSSASIYAGGNDATRTIVINQKEYMLETVIPQEADDLWCAVCINVVSDEAVVCNKCQNVYCKSDIEKLPLPACPSCRERSSFSTHLVKRRITNLIWEYPKGCGFSGSITEMKGHIAQCKICSPPDMHRSKISTKNTSLPAAMKSLSLSKAPGVLLENSEDQRTPYEIEYYTDLACKSGQSFTQPANLDFFMKRIKFGPDYVSAVDQVRWTYTDCDWYLGLVLENSDLMQIYSNPTPITHRFIFAALSNQQWAEQFCHVNGIMQLGVHEFEIDSRENNKRLTGSGINIKIFPQQTTTERLNDCVKQLCCRVAAKILNPALRPSVEHYLMTLIAATWICSERVGYKALGMALKKQFADDYALGFPYYKKYKSSIDWYQHPELLPSWRNQKLDPRTMVEDKKWTRHLNDRSNSSLCGSESWHATGRLRDRYAEEKTRISQQATTVNRLSQDLRQEINRTTILKIAAQITEQIKELTCASPKDLSLLANGFSRLKGKTRQISAKALKAIADEISKRQTRLTEVQDCRVQTLALLANGFSGVSGCEPGLKTLHAEVVNREAQLSAAQDCRVQTLALLANGFSGVSGCEPGLKILHAEVVNRKAQLSAAQGCRIQHLALLANGFSGISGCEPGLKILHAEVVNRKAQLSATQGCPVQNLALLANGFSGVSGCEPGLKILHAEVVNRKAQLSAAQGCRVQTLALLANGFSGVSGCEPGLKILHAEVVNRKARLSAAQGCPVQNLALLANGFSGVSGCEPGLKILHAEVVNREAQLSAAQGCRIQHLALLANGFSGVSGCEPGLKILHAEVVNRKAQLSAAQGCRVQTLALLANGFSGVSGCEPGLKILHAEVVNREAQLSAAQGYPIQNLALLANGFSGVSGCEPGLKILHAEVVNRKAQLSAAQGCRIQNLALLANGFSGVSGCEPGLKILHAEVVNREAQLSAAQGCRIQHLALLANGFSGVSGCEPGLKILHAEVVNRKAQLSAAQGCRVQTLALLTNGFSGVSGCEPGLKTLHAEVVNRKAQLSAAQGCPVQNLALLANGFSGVSGCEPGLKILHAEVVNRKAQLSAAQGCPVQNLALLANGFSGVSGCEPGLKILHAEVVNREAQLSAAQGCRIQHLALLANGFSGVSGCEPGLKILYAEASRRILSEASNWSVKDLTIILQVLCKCFTSVSQVTLGIRLFNELYRLRGGQLDAELLWYCTMLDFVATHNPHGFFFEAMPCGNCLPGELFFEASDQIFSEPKLSPADSETVWSISQWQRAFAFIYWYWPDRQHDDCPVLTPEQKPAVSRLQQKVYRALVKALPDQPIKMEVQIKQFPVDILVGQRLCIEVDGTHHFYQDESGEEANRKSPGMRRTIDYFIDHILHKLGFRVKRIPYTQVNSAQGLSDFVELVKRMVNQD